MSDAVQVRYRLDFFSPAGDYLGSSAEYFSLSYQRRENYATKLSVTFATAFFDSRAAWLEPYAMILLSASVNGSRYHVQENTAWIVTGKRRQWSEAGKVTTITAMCANWLLSSRVVAYAAASAQADKSGEIDALIKDVINENFGSGATDSARDASDWLEIAADLPSGTTASVDYAFSYVAVRRVLDTLAGKSFDNGTVLLYDVEPVIASGKISKFRFVTYVGYQGAARHLVFSPESGNVLGYTVHDDYSAEINAVYVGGSGTGASRTVREREDTDRQAVAPFGRREAFKTAPRLGTNAKLDDLGDSVLELNRPVRSFAVDVAETPSSIYGAGFDWTFGDQVNYQIEGETGSARVASVTVKVGACGARSIKCHLTTTIPIGIQYSEIDAADLEI
jgi:hypothetical protein